MHHACRPGFLLPHRRRGWSIRLLLMNLVVSLQCLTHALPTSPTTSLTRIPTARPTGHSSFDRRRGARGFPNPHAVRGGSRGSGASPSATKTSSSLSVFPPDAMASSAAIPSSDDALKPLAVALGYLVAAGSFILYTPIAVRVLRSKSAEGLTASTWWLKLTSYTCTDVYNIRNGFPVSAFSESLVLTLEAVVILALVTYYQKRMDGATLALACAYLAVTGWALLSPSNAFPRGPPDEWIALAQVLSTVLNTSALLPQLKQNWDRRSSGDYSPVSASLAAAGCAIRLFTTVELADSDPLILLNFGVALLMNLSVLCQVIYFGTQVEGRGLASLFLADVKSPVD